MLITVNPSSSPRKGLICILTPHQACQILLPRKLGLVHRLMSFVSPGPSMFTEATEADGGRGEIKLTVSGGASH